MSGVSFQIVVSVADDGVESVVYVGNQSAMFVSGERQRDGTTLEMHRKASAIYDRVIDFAEQIKK